MRHLTVHHDIHHSRGRTFQAHNLPLQMPLQHGFLRLSPVQMHSN